MVWIGNKAMGRGGGGDALVKAPEEKWGEMVENGGKCREMGKPNQSILAPQFLLFAPTPPTHRIPHFPAFSPISPRFSWCWVHYGYVARYITNHLVRVFLRHGGSSLSCTFLVGDWCPPVSHSIGSIFSAWPTPFLGRFPVCPKSVTYGVTCAPACEAPPGAHGHSLVAGVVVVLLSERTWHV